MNNSIKYTLFLAVVLGMLVTTFSSYAGLITRRGTTIGTDSFNQTVELHDETLSDIIDGAGLVSGSPISRFSRNSYYGLVYATPKDECHWNEVFDQFTNEYYRTACSYTYAYGEDISFFGSRDYLLAGAGQYDVLWTISGNGHLSTYSSSYSDTTSVDLDLTIFSPTLAAGTYDISLMLSIDSGPGKTFFEYSQYDSDYVCAYLGPGTTLPETCFQTGYDYDVWSWSGRSTLLVTASEPISAILLITGIFGLVGFRQRR